MDDNYLLPEHLKKILEENTSEPNNNEKEKFADRESIIDEEQIAKVVNLFLN